MKEDIVLFEDKMERLYSFKDHLGFSFTFRDLLFIMNSDNQLTKRGHIFVGIIERMKITTQEIYDHILHSFPVSKDSYVVGELIRLYTDEEYSLSDLVKLLKTKSVTNLFEILQRNGCVFRPCGSKKPEKSVLVRLLKTNKVSAIAETYGVTKATIYNWINSYEITREWKTQGPAMNINR